MKPARDIIKTLVLSEKVSKQTEMNNRYCVQVDVASNKLDIKKAVEELFKVRVTKINTFNRKGKKKRERMRAYGRTSATKRALVTLEKGDAIDIT